MATWQPALMAIRAAVRTLLVAEPAAGRLLVGCSGGADSLALAAAARAEGTALGRAVGAVVVDHRLHPDSAGVAATAAAQLRTLALDPVEVVAVAVAPGRAGLEAAAREARLAALHQAAARHRADLVLLGHTRDDQAEQVLLGLARGSGARSLSGMPPRRGLLARPLLSITRAQTQAACREAGLIWWSDPMNNDPVYARVRARAALTTLEADLGPGLSAALARSAEQLRVDADHLDALADAAAQALWPAPPPPNPPIEVDHARLAALPTAVRTRVWRRLIIAAGAPAAAVSSTHTDACDRLLTHWHGQGPIAVPGALAISRTGDRLTIARAARVE